MNRTTPTTPNPIHPTYALLPLALTRLRSLHSLTVTFGMPQPHHDGHHHLWRSLLFHPPDPEPPSDRDNQKAEHLSCLLHALGHASATSPLPLRALAFDTIGPAFWGADAVARLWNLDRGVVAAAEDGEEDDEEGFYAMQYLTLTAPVAQLTTLDVHVNYSVGGLGGLRYLAGPLAAFVRAARNVEVLGLVVESEPETSWRIRLAPDEALLLEKDVLLAVLVGGEEELWPRLRRLTLGVATSEASLMGVLGRVAGRLRRLRLCGVRFMSRLGDWGSAVRGLREVVGEGLEEVEAAWLKHDVAFAANGCEDMLVPRDVGEGVDVEAERRWRATYRHYEAQVCEYVLRKSEVEPVLDQGAFFASHPVDCGWCKDRSSESFGLHGAVQ